MDATEMELAGQIKKHRQALGISQEALAEKIYVSRQTISNWKRHARTPMFRVCFCSVLPSISLSTN